MARKPYRHASYCYDMLKRLAEQYKEMETQFREVGDDERADKEHEYYLAMIRAATVLVKTYDL